MKEKRKARERAPQAQPDQQVPVIRLKHPAYSPTKAEMEEDVSIPADPLEVLRAVLRPVRVEFEEKP